ncbi:MAG: type IX secretion system membrane protein PorP/SprF, partial [Dehalococcoidia bacterium]
GKVSPGLSLGHNNFILTAGGLISVSDLLKIKPSMLINYSLDKAEGISQFDINTNFIIADLVWLGAAYRISEQVVVGIAQLQVNSQLMIGLSYDYPVGRMQSYSSGSCEFVLRYDFGSKVSVSNPRYF